MSGAHDTRRLVVVAPNWLGDAVMSLPAIAHAAATPGCEVIVATSPYTARVYWNLDGVAEIQTDPASSRVTRIRSRTRALRAYGAHAVVILPPSFSSAVPAWFAGVAARIGFASDGRRTLLTNAIPTPPRTTHLSASYLELVRRALGENGAQPGAKVSAAGLRVADDERVCVAQLLVRKGIGRGAYVLVVPGAAYGPAKSWPRERYRRVCEALAGDVPVVLGGSGADRAACDEIASGLDGVANVAGDTTLGEFFALVEGARVLLANDSGAPHVAAALGVPTVVLFGSTLPEWTAPLGNRVVVMQHKVHCNPCFGRTCPTQLECFNGIDPSDVLTRVRAWLAEAGSAETAGAR